MQISEYVSLGHPDKVADYISEYILDRLIEKDPKTRYALEVQIKDNYVMLGGEITTNAKPKYKKWVKEAISDIGYTHEYAKRWGKGNTLDASKVKVKAHISQQSNDISQGVDRDGWGDQGIFFGMATNDTFNMPKDFSWARLLGMALYNTARNHDCWGLDIKTQFVLSEKDENPIKKIIVAVPFKKDESWRDEITKVVNKLFAGHFSDDFELIINGTGSYVKHASMGDCGTTGRKLAVDFYGGNCNVGGGSPWTKDGTKADLTLNLYARKKAVDYLRKHNMKYVKCGIGCCIGQNKIDITLWNKNNKVIESYSEKTSPKKLIKMFQLDKPIYADMCRYGLFQRVG